MHKAVSQKKTPHYLLSRQIEIWYPLLPPFILFSQWCLQLIKVCNGLPLCPQVLLCTKDMMKYFILKKYGTNSLLRIFIFLAARLAWTCTVTNYEIAGSGVRQVGEYFKFLLSPHHSVFFVVFKKWCWTLYRRYYGKFHGGSGSEPGDAWRDVKDLGRRQVFHIE